MKVGSVVWAFLCENSSLLLLFRAELRSLNPPLNGIEYSARKPHCANPRGRAQYKHHPVAHVPGERHQPLQGAPCGNRRVCQDQPEEHRNGRRKLQDPVHKDQDIVLETVHEGVRFCLEVLKHGLALRLSELQYLPEAGLVDLREFHAGMLKGFAGLEQVLRAPKI